MTYYCIIQNQITEGQKSISIKKLTHLAPDQPLPFRYEIPCEGK